MDFFMVIRKSKYFIVKIKGKGINILVDRLKPAYLSQTDEDISGERTVCPEEIIELEAIDSGATNREKKD
ncbi:hypothetical protein TNCV_2853641 [Trichonephila clavipes]|uniref:Uncharacterized protein n=1 Tax=Trichonephila clavipes TaxID=2585209 RepID=A0A8X6R7R2_TRICX|nr:hypothetical protein TNCV_2853641 [Trichonephila clavipes]